MNARRDASDGPEAGSMVGRALLVGAVVFAAAATGLLVLTDEQKWLRLGIVAALWAALTGAFLAVWYRRQVTDQREAIAERQQIYELELEREVAARREHELEVEAAARRKAEESSRDDLAALRAELQNMRQTLEGLLGGEFLVERYALRAEATRMRSIEEDRSPARKHLPAAVVQQANVVSSSPTREGETELIERVRDGHPKPRREPRPEQRVADSRPPSAPRRTERPPRPERPTPEPAAARVEHPAEVSDRWFVPDGLQDQQPPSIPMIPPSRTEQPRRQESQRPADPPPRRPTPGWDTGEQEWAPSWEKKKREEPARQQANGAGPGVPHNTGPQPGLPHNTGAQVGLPHNTGPQPGLPYNTGPQPGLPYETGSYPAVAANRASWLSQYNEPISPRPNGTRASAPPPPRIEPAPPTTQLRTPAAPPTTPTPVQRPTPAPPTAPVPAQPAALSPETSASRMSPIESASRMSPVESASRMSPVQSASRMSPVESASRMSPVESASRMSPVQSASRMSPVESASRMSPVESASRIPPVEESGGGRRRRAEGQPSWQETVGHHDADEPSGSHASGRSVSELLAKNGLDTSPRRRRRRED